MEHIIEVIKISTDVQLQHGLRIRFEVFVEEQGCPADIEIENEQESIHFLAYYNHVPAGTARYRKTPNGYKLERFAVEIKYRYFGIGRALVLAILHDINPSPRDYLYLNAQILATDFYRKLGFEPVGDLFEEASILHQKMVLSHKTSV